MLTYSNYSTTLLVIADVMSPDTSDDAYEFVASKAIENTLERD